MPMTLRVGCSRKLGRPAFGSVGASCGMDLELDAGLAERDPEALRARIRAAFAACRAAVAEELAREDEPGDGPVAGPPTAPPADGRPIRRDRAEADDGASPSPGRPGRPASEKQVKAIRSIARRHGADLATILRQDYGVERPEELSVGQASRLIDGLKADAAV